MPYPEATKVWTILQDYGYNDYVCAGIMGNLMVETGGNTLDLDPDLVYYSYYGLCQWSYEYFPSVWYSSLEEQCEFLHDTIEYEINTFGF